jgi:hypothetical protein
MTASIAVLCGENFLTPENICVCMSYRLLAIAYGEIICDVEPLTILKRSQGRLRGCNPGK